MLLGELIMTERFDFNETLKAEVLNEAITKKW